MWPWYLALTNDVDLGTEERSHHKEYTIVCEIRKLYHLPFKIYNIKVFAHK